MLRGCSSGVWSENLKQSSVKLGLSRLFIFQYDNDAEHTSLLVKNYLQKTKVNVTEWPAESLDFNPFENMWGDLKKNIPEGL